MAAELAGPVAERVAAQLDFVGLFAGEGQCDLPVVDLVLGEVVEGVLPSAVDVALPVFVVIVRLEDDRAPPVEDLEPVLLDEVDAADDGLEPIVDAVSDAVRSRGEGVGDKHGNLVVDDQQVDREVGASEFILNGQDDLVFAGFVVPVQRVGMKLPLPSPKVQFVANAVVLSLLNWNEVFSGDTVNGMYEKSAVGTGWTVKSSANARVSVQPSGLIATM